MYTPLPQEDPSSVKHSRTPSPNFNKSISTIRNWWLLLLVFMTSIVLMFLSLSTKHSPAQSNIKPVPEDHQLSDAIKHNVAYKELSVDLHEEKTKQLIKEGNSVHNQLKTCSKPVSKLGFMKTHKTASSTVQNILMRFTMNSDWNFAMYATGSHLGPPNNQYLLNRPFSSSWLDNVPWNEMVQQQGYNVFAVHTQWDQGEVERVLGPGAKYFTILRDPVDQFESLYNYVHFDKSFNMDLEGFVEHYIVGKRPIQRVNGYLGRNQQLWDLGMDRDDITNHEAVKLKIKQMDKDFDLVMISEDFDSSLVLLSDLLCWPLGNMTSLKINARKKSAVEKLSPKSRKILKDWLWADYMLYDYFRKELVRKKTIFGEDRISSRVLRLKELNQKVKSECVLEVVRNTKNLTSDYVPWSKDVLAFKIDESKEMCKYFGISENHFIDYLRKLQMERLRRWRLTN